MIEAADKGKPPNRIILAGGYSTSPYLQRILKEATKPEKIFSDSRHSRFRNPAYNNWTVDKDPLFTVLKGDMACLVPVVCLCEIEKVSAFER